MPAEEDVIGPPVKLFQYRQAREDLAAGPSDWIVEKIMGHRRGPNGDPVFEVLWEGATDTTWEPLANFFHRYNPMVIEYCRNQDIEVPMVEYLHRHPPEDDAMVAAMRVAKGRASKLQWEEPPQS